MTMEIRNATTVFALLLLGTTAQPAAAFDWFKTDAERNAQRALEARTPKLEST